MYKNYFLDKIIHLLKSYLGARCFSAFFIIIVFVGMLVCFLGGLGFVLLFYM